MPPKQKIPKALREQVWLHYIGKQYETKCPIVWCTNKINVHNFHVGHNIPESKGGTLDIKNLRPICSSCNLSMSDNYTIDEWNALQSYPSGAEQDKQTGWMLWMFLVLYVTQKV